jgi:glucose-1-phosphate cytidylyltransferase
VVILAGGLGTRIAEESDLKPKPMIDIAGQPMILRIMSHFASHGFTDFLICAGYRGYQIKEYFSNFHKHTSDFSVDLSSGEIELIGSSTTINWTVAVVDTGLETQTGGRIRRVSEFLDSTFFLTYGDGISDIDLKAELAYHRSHGRLATVAAVRPPSRFAVLETKENGAVSSFREKPEDEVGWINGGFFILEPQVLNLIKDDKTVWERDPLQELARRGELMAFFHEGFWQAVDSLRDKRLLEEAFATNGILGGR